jgi:KaiC/GvpD/RAD55 family RecA-like ATPase
MTLIPGLNHLFSRPGEFPRSVMLLVGPSGSGKTAYAIQFLREGVAGGDYCLYINCNQALSKEKFNSYFSNRSKATQVPAFLSLSSLQKPEAAPAGIHASGNGAVLQELLEQIKGVLREDRIKGESSSIKVVLDSLTHLIARFSDDAVQKFVTGLYDFMKSKERVMALLALTGSPSVPTVDVLGSLVDGIIQLRMEDSGQQVQRDIRILSLKTAHNVPRWVRFHIEHDGSLRFGDENSTAAMCKLCHEPITGQVAFADESPFHPRCLDTYRKLGEIYGSHSTYALEPGVVNASFFFIDIVGLSDLHLSVEMQTKKIENLNSLIGSCDAYKRVPRDEKIVLPTGDGMAIGFLMNPELPLQLSIQLHRKLRAFNAGMASDRTMGVRIGLSSGPVFVVSDINNNQNVWGPGIILARRVMDLGDSDHILLADNIAESLINLKDEYRGIIRQVSAGYKIKHGQLLRLYSAYSQDFGNPATPSKISEVS